MVIFKFRNLNTGQAMPIPPGEFSVGRADEAYIHIEDGSVSRRHAIISNQDDGLFLEDLGSANGTAAHGVFVTGRVRLDFGDVVHVGSVPFRVDPEVAGEKHAPTMGMRPVSRAYMTRETERLPMGEVKRDGTVISPEMLSAPEVSWATDKDAEELNAITITEPQLVPPSRLPTVRAGLTALTSPTSARLGLPAFSFKSSTPSTAATEPPPPTGKPKEDVVSPEWSGDTPEADPQTTELSPERPTTDDIQMRAAASLPEGARAEAGRSMKGVWVAVVFFMAGLGAGLVLGLYFAKLFLEMGGKAAALP